MTPWPPTMQEWLAHDPDPGSAAELAACSADELRERFAHSLTFGTAGLRGPLRAGPNGMNLAVVLRTTWGVTAVLAERGLGGGGVVVGYDARHRSAEFGRAAAEVFAAQGFSVTLMPGPVPTPVVAFAVRRTGAVAGVQITASHNPPTDNGYKVYLDGGLQIVSPTDRDIEQAIASAP
ncbi:MAG: phospho-sugar mutase, partial [Mycobacterium sp.]|nr:phospho-sugar mutase [Mycobacterium sp.]